MSTENFEVKLAELYEQVIVTLTQTKTENNDDKILVRTFHLTADRPSVQIGRASKAVSKGLCPAPDNGYFESPVMSRSHAILTADMHKGTVTLKDAGSLHGICVNKEVIGSTVHTLTSGDLITFGIHVARGLQIFEPITTKLTIASKIAPTRVEEEPRAYRAPEPIDLSEDSSDEEDEDEVSAEHFEGNESAGALLSDVIDVDTDSPNAAGRNGNNATTALDKGDEADETVTDTSRSFPSTFLEAMDDECQPSFSDYGENDSAHESDSSFGSNDDADDYDDAQDYGDALDSSLEENMDNDVMSENSEQSAHKAATEEAIQAAAFMRAEILRFMADQRPELPQPHASTESSHAVSKAPTEASGGQDKDIEAENDAYEPQMPLPSTDCGVGNETGANATTKKCNISSILNPTPIQPLDLSGDVKSTLLPVSESHTDNNACMEGSQSVSGWSHVEASMTSLRTNPPSPRSNSSVIISDDVPHSGLESTPGNEPGNSRLNCHISFEQPLHTPPLSADILATSSAADLVGLVLPGHADDNVPAGTNTTAPQANKAEKQTKKRKAEEMLTSGAETDEATAASYPSPPRDNSVTTRGSAEISTPDDFPVAKRQATRIPMQAKKTIKGRVRHVAESIGFAALGGAVVLGSLIYTAPTF